jgi:MFS family permease
MARASSPRPPLGQTAWALGFTSLFTDVGTEMIFPLLPLFLTEVLHAGPTALGLIEGAADTVSSALKLVSGWILDRWPRAKQIALFGYSLSSALRPLVGFATAPWQVFAIRLGDRVGKGLRGTAADKLLAESTPPGAAGRVFGFNRAMDNLGAVIGPLAATGLLIVTGHKLRTVFFFAAIPGALAVLSLAIGVRQPKAPLQPAPPASADGGSVEPLPRSLIAYLIVSGFFALSNSSDAFLLLRAIDLGVASTAIPLLWIVLNVSKMLCSYPLGELSDRWGRFPALLLGYGWYAASYCAFALVPRGPGVWILFALYGVFYGLTEGVGKALIADLAPRSRLGLSFGLYNGLIGVAALPAGLLTGWLWRLWGGPLALGVCAVLAFLAAGGLAVLALTTRTTRSVRA